LDTTNKVVISIAIAFVLVIAITVGWLIWQNEQARLAATIPSSPETLRSVKVTTTEVTLEWLDVSNNELGFKLFRNGELVRDDIAKDSTSVFDYGLQPSTVYEYEVVASNKAGDSLRSEIVIVKTKNYTIVGRLDKIGVADNGEPFFREIFDKRGEIYLGVIIRDGERVMYRRLPSDGYYRLADNQILELGIPLFYIPDVGKDLSINIICFEHDHVGLKSDGGLAEELLLKAGDMAVKGSMGNLYSLILDVAGVDFTDTIRDISGFADDFMGEYDQIWSESDNWGVGNHQDIRLDKGDGTGVILWYSISKSIGQ